MRFRDWNMPPERASQSGAPAPAGRDAAYLVVTLDSSARSVRAALAETRAGLAPLRLGSDAAGTIELVLAEVMNNICEHAYAGIRGGRIELSVWVEGDVLRFEVRDDGAPMPGGRVPSGRPLPLDRELDALPEGGFGWSLIRHFATELTYARSGGRNRLRVRMRRDARPAGG